MSCSVFGVLLFLLKYFLVGYGVADLDTALGVVGGGGQIGGRKHRFGREQMVTGSASGTILAP